jgi:predicted DsbA family dithiol-disulfide isomerase
VEAGEFPGLAQQYAVYGVPKTIINDTGEVLGAVPEAEVVKAILAALAPPAAPTPPA